MKSSPQPPWISSLPAISQWPPTTHALVPAGTASGTLQPPPWVSDPEELHGPAVPGADRSGGGAGAAGVGAGATGRPPPPRRRPAVVAPVGVQAAAAEEQVAAVGAQVRGGEAEEVG